MNINESEQILICMQTWTQSPFFPGSESKPLWSLDYHMLIFIETTLSANSADTFQSVALLSTVGLSTAKSSQIDHSSRAFVKPSLLASRFGFLVLSEVTTWKKTPKSQKQGVGPRWWWRSRLLDRGQVSLLASKMEVTTPTYLRGQNNRKSLIWILSIRTPGP